MESKIVSVLSSKHTSYWLREAIAVLLERDPVDALNDAELLVVIMTEHLDSFRSKSTGKCGCERGEHG